MWERFKWWLKIGWQPVMQYVEQHERTFEWIVTTTYVNKRTGEHRETVKHYDEEYVPPWW